MGIGSTADLAALEALSIRARMALAVACWDLAVAGVDPTNPELRRLLDVLWVFPAAADLGAWEPPSPAGAAWGGVDRRLRAMYGDVAEVGFGNLHADPRSELTLRPLLHVLAAARGLRIEVPDLRLLADHSWDEEGGWGRPILDPRDLLLPTDPQV